jgi:hypothetical protein
VEGFEGNRLHVRNIGASKSWEQPGKGHWSSRKNLVASPSTPGPRVLFLVSASGTGRDAGSVGQEWCMNPGI